MPFIKSWALPIFLMLILIFIQCRLWFERDGIIDMLRLKKQAAMELIENDKLKKRNELLLQQIQHLKKNDDAVEAHARHELGMIKKGETFYRVVKP